MFGGKAKITRERALAGLGGALLLASLIAAYANHFYNSFHFDDAHTIETNAAIRELRNIPLFFRDATTFSSLPSNQSYRPLVSTLLAIDYSLGHGLRPFWFHLSIFVLFVALVLLVAFVIYRLFEMAAPSSRNGWIALVAAGWYGLHPANADTVNYIVASSEVISTLGVIASFAAYFGFPHLRRYYTYVLPAAIAVLAKPTAAIFPVLFAFYLLLFEQNKTRHREAATAYRGNHRTIPDLRSDVVVRATHDAAQLGRWRGQHAQLPDHAALCGAALFQDVLLAGRSLRRLRP